MSGKRLKSDLKASWWITQSSVWSEQIIICNAHTMNARRPFSLMKLQIKVRARRQENKTKQKLSENNFRFVANSRFKSIFHRWRALYRTQSCACFRFLLSHIPCENEKHRINENNRTLKTGTFTPPPLPPNHSILFAHHFTPSFIIIVIIDNQ